MVKIKIFPVSMCCVCPCHKRGFGDNYDKFYCYHSAFVGTFGAKPKIKATIEQLHIKNEFETLDICPLEDYK